VRDDQERLRDILEALERIEKYSVRGRAALESDDLLQTWVVHHPMIVVVLGRRIRRIHHRDTESTEAGLDYGVLCVSVVKFVVVLDSPHSRPSFCSSTSCSKRASESNGTEPVGRSSELNRVCNKEPS
jgi:hypothetical protein